MIPKNRTLSLLDMEFYIIQEVFDAVVHIQLFKKETQHFQPFLINLKVDACDFLKTRRSNRILVRIIANYLLPFSNMNFTCPYKGPILFKNFNFDPGFLPSIWPYGYYKMSFILYLNRDPKAAAIATGYFEMKEKNRLSI